MLNQDSLSNLQKLLVCPACKGKLEFLNLLIKCKSCNQNFTQIAHDWWNLMPNTLLKEENQWEKRLKEMEDWYNNLIANPQVATECFIADYTPYAPLLTTLSGNILDLGGGIGIPRNYLPTDTKYIVIDPSFEWLTTDWSSLGEEFPCLKQKPNFVRGVGEYLPFPSQSFDAVLSFWSLNHASDPRRVFSEVYRVLKPGGRCLVVLEEMMPQWFDLFNLKFPARQVFNSFFNPELIKKRNHRIRLFIKLISCKNWPLQNDHIRIQEADIKNWSKQKFKVINRIWFNQYLTFDLIKMK